MRFPSWRATPPQVPADRAKLQERLTKLTTPPVQDDAPAPSVVTAAPISPARAKLQELTGAGAATPASAPITPVATETNPAVANPVPAAPAVTPEPLAVAPISAAVEPVVALVPYSASVPVTAAPIGVQPESVLVAAATSLRDKKRRRRRRLSFSVSASRLPVV